jgi:hypothetical protein
VLDESEQDAIREDEEQQAYAEYEQICLESADERRDEALWQREEARIDQEREMERRALFAACEGDDGPY